MMGTTHAASGVTVWLAAFTPLHAAVGVTTGQATVGAALTAGAAMLPDLDQGGITWRRRLLLVPVPRSHGATIARTYGFLTAALAWCVGKLAGGHREGTHSALGVLVFTILAAAATRDPWPQAAAVWLLLGVAARAADLALPGHVSSTALLHALVMALVTAVVIRSGVDVAEVLPWTVALGCAVHIAGDCCTKRKCPLLWPVSSRRFGRDLVGTDSTAERWIVTPLLLVANVALLLWLSGAAGMVAKAFWHTYV